MCKGNQREPAAKTLDLGLAEVTTNNSHVLVAGDFNHPDIDWQDGTTPPDTNNKATNSM